MKIYMGIDVGTTNLKVAAFTSQGELAAYHSEPTPISHPKAGWAEMDPDEIWSRIQSGIISTAAKCEGEICSIGISSMGESGILCDFAGRPLYPFIAWYDTRCEEQARTLEGQMGRDQIYQITGQIPSAKYGLAKLMWLKEQEPECYRKAFRWLSVEDWILFCLTGEYATDYSIAARTMAFDIERLEWSEEILNAAGISADLFPKAYPGGTAVGIVRGNLAEKLGLKGPVPVSTGGHDHACAAIAVNILEDGVVLDSMGTAEVLMAAAEKNVACDETKENNYSVYPHCGNKLYRVVTSNQSCGVCIEWYLHSFGNEIRKKAAEINMSAYDYLMEIAARDSGRDPEVLFFPFLRGAVENSRLRGTFWGMSDADTEGDYILAILDGLGCEIRRQLDGYRKLLPEIGNVVRVVGGPAKSAFMMQRKAMMQNCVIETPEYTEAACLGAALLGAIGMGEMGFADLAKVYRKGTLYESDGQDKRRRTYQRYTLLREEISRVYRQEPDCGNVKEQLEFRYSDESLRQVEQRLDSFISADRRQYFVIDDDPTGGQTVHDMPVYTKWDEETMERAFLTEKRLLYVMTNSRSLISEESKMLHAELLANIKKAAGALGREYGILSRGDSTLRGHYPLEIDMIRNSFGGEVRELLIPMFPEGERYTVQDIHYLKEGEDYIPCAQSDYAKDQSFGYQNSNLKKWIEEKTNGECKEASVGSISLEMLHAQDFDRIARELCNPLYKKYVINAVSYEDLKVFAIGYFMAVGKGVRFVARTASAWPRVLGGIKSKPLVSPAQILENARGNGGLVVVGSHVKKTTAQLKSLLEQEKKLADVEFDQHLVLDQEKLQLEISRVVREAEDNLKKGVTVVVHTRRERIDLEGASREAQLKITNEISRAVTSIVSSIETRPSFVITKGGITSSDILVNAMNTSEALIVGQIYPGVPVWRLGNNSRYPGMPFVIFPGNVGKDDTLAQMVRELCRESERRMEEKNE